MGGKLPISGPGQRVGDNALHQLRSDWVPALLQLTDTFYPTGSYAHSFGLEGLVQDGFVTDLGTLRSFLLEQALPALARTDLVVAAAAWEAAGAKEGAADFGALEELCELASAMRGAREPREAAEAIGRQRLELLGRRGAGNIGFAEVVRGLKRRAAAPTAVVAAIEARVIGAPVEAALSALIYSAAAGLLAAAVKLLRLGQNAVQGLLTEALALAPALIAQALETSLEDAGSFTPWWDVAAARHERADFRLFIS